MRHHAGMKRASTHALLIALALLLSACGDDSSSTQKSRVLIIGMDGTRAEALELANTPHLDALRAAGVADMHAITGDVSLSGPGWASMLTGVWCDKHHVVDNDATWVQSRFDLYPHFIQRLEEQSPEMRTVSVSHWAAINDEILCADENGGDCGHADVVINTASDAQVRDEVVAELRDGDPDVIFLQFDDIDHAGHGDPATFDPGGFCPFAGGDAAEGSEGGVCLPLNYNPAYLAAIETTDAYIGEILDALYQRPDHGAENWLIIVSPDHGGAGTVFNQHGFPVDQDRRTFTIISAAGLQPLPDARLKIVDIAATALHHLSLPVDPQWGMDGQAVALPGVPAYEDRPIPTCYDPNTFVPDSGTRN